jgi:hypothetical protein
VQIGRARPRQSADGASKGEAVICLKSCVKSNVVGCGLWMNNLEGTNALVEWLRHSKK